MHIAYLTQSYPPTVSGAAVVVQGLAEGMARRGHQVLVLTSSETSKPYDIVKPGLTIKRFGSFRNPLRVDHYFSLWPHRHVIQALNQFSPDVIHSHDPLQFGLSSLMYSRRNDIYNILTIHQLPWFVRAYLPEWKIIKNTTESVLWAYFRKVCRYNKFVTPSHPIAEEVFAQSGITPQVIGYGLNPSIFFPTDLPPPKKAAIRRKLGIPPNTQIMLHTGRLDKDKQVDLVIRAAAQVMANLDFHLVVVGDGTEKNNLIKLCQELGIAERSHFPGFVSRERALPDILRIASVFVTASEIETQGLALLEAAACGLPIVAVDATCISEIVKHGNTGFLAEPGDINSMAASIEFLLRNPSSARSMGLAGSEISKNLGLEKTLDTHEMIYKQATAHKKVHRDTKHPHSRSWVKEDTRR